MPITKKQSEEKKEKKSIEKWKFIGGGIALVVFIAFVWLVVEFIQAQKEIKLLSDPSTQQELVEKEVQEIIEKVKKHILIPEGEEPVLATISDVDSLKEDQPFYKDARNGQKVIIFSEIAIIYDVEQDVLVNVGPVVRSEELKDKEILEEQSEPDGPITIDIRNGSKTIGVAQELSVTLDDEKYTVGSITNAASRNYTGNTIINLKERNIDELAEQLDAIIQDQLPSEEKTSDADIVIIIGNEEE